jgi:hypothetical protein
MRRRRFDQLEQEAEIPGMTQFHSDYGSLKPEQLSSLQSISDDVCTNLDPISTELREEVARKLLLLSAMARFS